MPVVPLNARPSGVAVVPVGEPGLLQAELAPFVFDASTSIASRPITTPVALVRPEPFDPPRTGTLDVPQTAFVNSLPIGAVCWEAPSAVVAPIAPCPVPDPPPRY